MFIHKIVGSHCRAKVAGVDTHFDVHATVFDPRPDGPEFRDLVKTLLESASGSSDFDLRNLRFSLGGFVPRQFADEDRVIVTPSAASEDESMSAKVQIVFDVSEASRRGLDRYFEFETNLENHLEALNVGFVDGNEIGGGEYRVFCYGRSRGELAEAVSEFAAKCAPGTFTIE